MVQHLHFRILEFPLITSIYDLRIIFTERSCGETAMGPSAEDIKSLLLVGVVLAIRQAEQRRSGRLENDILCT